jgi:hypothetical protein
MSLLLAENLRDYHRRAVELGLGKEFRLAFQKLWSGLHTRPLPPDESPETLGELRYTTPHHPQHRVCIASVKPITIYFSIFDEDKEGEVTTLVNIIRIIPMLEP